MAPATEAAATASGLTSHTQNQAEPAPATPLPTAPARLLRQLADHDTGAGVALQPLRGGRYRHPHTGDTFTGRTLAILGARRLITFGASAHDPVTLTPAGRATAQHTNTGRSAA